MNNSNKLLFVAVVLIIFIVLVYIGIGKKTVAPTGQEAIKIGGALL